MAPVEIECGHSHLERRNLSFTKADKDRIAQNFPDKIAVSVAGFGGQEFLLRPYIKAILDQVQPPAVKIAIAVRGEPDDLESVEIDDVKLKVTGTTAGRFKVADADISYAFDADIMPGDMTIEACECEGGGEGHRKSRTFKCTWEIEISIDPGIAGVYEIEEFEITVMSPCDCPDHEFELDDAEAGETEDDPAADADEHDDDDRDAGKGKKKSGKKKAKGRGK
jgi:hypothetical protein